MSEELYDIYANAKDMSLDKAYDYCLKLEYDREYSWRTTNQGELESSYLHLDDPSMRNTDENDSPGWESDNGEKMKHIRRMENHEAVEIALKRLNVNDRAFAQSVLEGKSWREMGIPKPTFYRRLKKVETFLAPIK